MIHGLFFFAKLNVCLSTIQEKSNATCEYIDPRVPSSDRFVSNFILPKEPNGLIHAGTLQKDCFQLFYDLTASVECAKAEEIWDNKVSCQDTNNRYHYQNHWYSAPKCTSLYGFCIFCKGFLLKLIFSNFLLVIWSLAVSILFTCCLAFASFLRWWPDF